MLLQLYIKTLLTSKSTLNTFPLLINFQYFTACTIKIQNELIRLWFIKKHPLLN